MVGTEQGHGPWITERAIGMEQGHRTWVWNRERPLKVGIEQCLGYDSEKPAMTTMIFIATHVMDNFHC